jgi:DNA-binding response OmpR family regulator
MRNLAMHRILLADDEQELTWAIQLSLQGEGYNVVTAADGIEALVSAGRHRPDLVILDATMPRLDGWQVCHSLRRDPDLATVPIMFLSGNDSIEDRVRGLEAGADDYLVKPFDLRELKARIRALLRRASAAAPAPAAARATLVTAGDLSLNPQTGEVTVAGRQAQLTPAELELLHYLMQHPDTVFSSQHLLQHVWGYAPDTAEQGLVRWHMMNLRAKIEANPSHPVYLRTVPRHGYMFCAQARKNAA